MHRNILLIERQIGTRPPDRYTTRLLIAGAAGTVLVAAVGVFAVQLAFTTPRVLPIAGAPNMSDCVAFTVSGRIYNIGANIFLLKDSTGAAEVETCPLWYRRISLRDGERVNITGEILQVRPESAEARYRIAAYRIERQGRPGIVLRTAVGRPPWVRSGYIQRVR